MYNVVVVFGKTKEYNFVSPTYTSLGSKVLCHCSTGQAYGMVVNIWKIDPHDNVPSRMCEVVPNLSEIEQLENLMVKLCPLACATQDIVEVYDKAKEFVENSKVRQARGKIKFLSQR